MKKYDVELCKLKNTVEIAENIFSFILDAPYISQCAAPGQFVHIKLQGRTLRRPISICSIDKNSGELRIVFEIRGEGTAELAALKEGTVIDVLGPLGNGFPMVDKEKKALFVGGGIGVPPLLEAAKLYGKNATAVLGFRNKSAVILEEDFNSLGVKTIITTDDGSYGSHGLVTSVIPDEAYDVIYTCGPAPMIKSVTGIAKDKGCLCYVSLEERMACGIGACLGCACKLIDDNGNEYNGHVCKDGPVFDYRKVYEYGGG